VTVYFPSGAATFISASNPDSSTADPFITKQITAGLAKMNALREKLKLPANPDYPTSSADLCTSISIRQQTLARVQHESDWQELDSQLLLVDDWQGRLRLASLKGQGSLSWITALPSSGSFRISPPSMQLNIRHTLGEDLGLGLHELAACSCSKHHNTSDYSLEVCTTCGGYTENHNTNVAIIAELAQVAGGVVTKEPSGVFPNSQRRPDIAISNIPELNKGYHTTYIDYTQTNCQQTCYRTEQGIQGVAAAAAAKAKTISYALDCEANGGNFIPAAQENFGFMDPQFIHLITTLATKIKGNLPGQVASYISPLTYFMQRLAVARVNALNHTMRAKARKALPFGVFV
jgi:hypothetical protein